MNFQDLGLGEEILRAVEECGYTQPTPIQQQAIPQILMGRDLVGLAQTGTGKTAGFTLPMIEILAGGRAKARMPRSLILSPTRELAAQISENFDLYGKYHPLSMALIVGGTSMDEQIKKLERGVDVLIATPGRLLDLFERGRILLTDIKILVIDEADRMMDMGFIPDIEKIVGLLPPIRQTLLFSATMPDEIRKLTKKFLMNPREVAVSAPASTAEKVEQHLLKTTARGKSKALLDLLARLNVGTAIVFCNRKRDIDGVCRALKQKKYNAAQLHGDMAQSARTKTLQDFKDGAFQILVCSDVAARGLDIDDLSHVFNYDVPMNADDYVHRIGRTGRAGKDGQAWTLYTPADDKYLEAIEKRIQKPIPVYGGEAKTEKSAPSASKPAEKTEKKKVEEQKSPKKTGGSDHKRPKPAHKKPDHEDLPDSAQGFGNDVPAFFRQNS